MNLSVWNNPLSTMNKWVFFITKVFLTIFKSSNAMHCHFWFEEMVNSSEQKSEQCWWIGHCKSRHLWKLLLINHILDVEVFIHLFHVHDILAQECFFQEIKVEAIIDVLSSWSLGSIIIKNQITTPWILRNQQEIHLTSVSSSHVFIILFLNQSLFLSPTQLLSYLLKRIVVLKKSIHQKP